jgi:SAM-dependent methyltransferase
VTELRRTFDQVPDLYERARPSYPPEVIDDVSELARLRAQARIVEIGCGTGQATVPLAERGHRIVCVELGPHLAAAARTKLAPFPDVDVVNADFETWEPLRAGFDAVLAFTSFHWLARETRYARCASLLRQGGSLAVVATQHVLPEDGDPFFAEVQADYEAVLPDDPGTKAGGPPPPDAVRGLGAELEASGFFQHAGERRRLWDVVYDADTYLDVLNTYSGHRALPGEQREELLARIRRRIETRPGGTVRKTYLATIDAGVRV